MKKRSRFTTDFFSPRLFWEGLKRLRVLALGVLIIALAISISAPIVDWMERIYNEPPAHTTDFYFDEEAYYSANVGSSSLSPSAYDNRGGNVVRYSQINTALSLLPFAAPLFVLVLFSFLFKRNESDFYHSLPYKRQCVFLSFAAAAATWILAITLLSALTAGILWIANPYRVLLIKDLLLLTLTSLFSSLLIASFALLAVSLCGNLVSALINFAVLVFLPRWTLCLMGNLLENTISSISSITYLGGFLSTKWCLPLRLFENKAPETGVLIYSALAALLVGALAGLAFVKRGSETAGNSVLGKRLHILLRCLFTLPFALYFTQGVLINGANHVAGSEVYVWLLVILVAYFLYELIATKRPRNLLRAIPHLLTVVGICLVFALSFFGLRGIILSETYEAKDIEHVKIISGTAIMKDNGSYRHSLFTETEFDDPEVLLQIERIHKESKQYNRTVFVWENLKRPGSLHTLTQFEITLKSGRTVTRSLYVSSENLLRLKEELAKTEAYQALSDQLPPLERISGASIFMNRVKYDYTLTATELEEFYPIFVAEYTAASEKAKDHLYSGSYEQSGCIVLEQYGTTSKGKYYHESYYVTPEEFPRSYQWLQEKLLKKAPSYDDDEIIK